MLPTEPIGSIPRPPALLDAIAEWGSDDPASGAALRGGDPRHHPASSRRPARRSSPTASSGSTTTSGPTPVHGLAEHGARTGSAIPFAAGHTRRMPRLTAGPFRYQRYADELRRRRPALRHGAGQAGGHLAVGAEPDVPVRRDSRATPATQFIEDLLAEHDTEIRRCLRGRRAPPCRSISPKPGWR